MEFILENRPGTLFVDDPSTYIRSPGSEVELRRANEYLTGIIGEGWVERLVVDHHLARDLDYRERIAPVLEVGEEAGVFVGVAAEFLDVEPSFLEASRKELFGKAEI
jgi:predicted metallo-beta-lactamase superfamily hydrolase